MCFHNSMSAKAIKGCRPLRTPIGCSRDLPKHSWRTVSCECVHFPQISYHYFFGRSTGFQLGTHPFLGKKRRGCDRNKKDDTQCPCGYHFRETVFPRTDHEETVHSAQYRLILNGGRKEQTRYLINIYVKDDLSSRWPASTTVAGQGTGEEHETFSIITTDTNSLTDYIDNTKHRMPAILTQEEEEKWLNPSLSKAEIASLLKPFDTEKMDAYVIRNDFLKKSPNDPTIVQRA